MKKLQMLLLLLLFLSIIGCKDNSEKINDSDTELTTIDEDGNIIYSDGTYCADIEYYNPDTGTRSTYSLNIEVENNEVTVIHWPNGGWLDDSHFSPEELDSEGYCSFTSDKGYEYTIQITGPECNFTDESVAQSDSEEDQREITCPKCGEDKESYDDLCWYCNRKEKRKKEDTEEHTCKLCGQYDPLMFSTDELCSDCEKAYENKKRDEED